MLENYDNFRKALEKIDFNKIHDVMLSKSWKWGGKVPDIWELKDTCYCLYKDCLVDLYLNPEAHEALSGTGGFEVRVRRNESIEILFILERGDIYNWELEKLKSE